MDYKKYSLENLENWMHDALSCSEASPQEIYDVIKGVVSENYHIYKNHTERCYELLTLLNGNGKGHINLEEPYPFFVSEDGDVWIPDSVTKEDKIVKWQLPVELDGLSGECYVNLPDDLLEAANIKENDLVEWIDRKDGSFELRKVNGTK
jgi:hypothetical protein